MPYPYHKSVDLVMSEKIVDFIEKFNLVNNAIIRILHIGCGTSLKLEEMLRNKNVRFVCDRVDVDLIEVSHPNVRNQWRATVEDMQKVPSSSYDIISSNWLLEHVPDIQAAVSEISRTLCPSGRIFTTIPNPTAFEFIISRYSPLFFHKLIRGGHNSWPTHYSYKSIQNLVHLFESQGLTLLSDVYHPAYEIYLYRYPIVNLIAKGVDYFLTLINNKNLLGHVFLEFEKTVY